MVNAWKGVARQVGRGERDRGQYDAPAERDYADGVCMLIPRGAIEHVGTLDEEYFMYWEETDWCARARAIGLKCYYVPEARIWHKAARSRSPDAAFQYLYRRNALMYVRKRGTRLQLLTTVLMNVFVYAPLYFLRHPTKIGRAAAEARALMWHASNQPRQRPLV
jgi:GT2 family glycosyltransferase